MLDAVSAKYIKAFQIETGVSLVIRRDLTVKSG